MGAGKILLVGAVAAGLAFVLLNQGEANAAQDDRGTLPPGVVIPDNAILINIGPSTQGGIPFAIKQWSWRADGVGATFVFKRSAASSSDWAMFLMPDDHTQAVQVLGQGTTANSGLIAQATVAGVN